MTESDAIEEVVDVDGIGPAGDHLVDRAIDSMGELVLDFPARVGARPYARFAPYENYRGVRIQHWAIVSMYPERMPGRKYLSEAHIVRPNENDDYPLRHFSTPWIRQMVHESRVVELRPVEDTPFGGMFQYIDPTETDGGRDE